MRLRKSFFGFAAAAALMAGAQARAETVPHAAPAAAPKPAKVAKVAKVAKAPTRAAPAAAAPVVQVQAAPIARPAPTEREIAVLFDLWNAALQTGSPELVASLYAPDGVLLPTVSNRVRTTRAEIVDYFQHFLALQPRGVINQSFIRVMGPDLALHSGIYTFDVVRDGKPEQVTARFDYLYRRINGRWLIANHHSSKMPEPVTPGSIQTAAVH